MKGARGIPLVTPGAVKRAEAAFGKRKETMMLNGNYRNIPGSVPLWQIALTWASIGVIIGVLVIAFA